MEVDSVRAQTGNASDFMDRRTEQVGLVAGLMCRSKTYRLHQLTYLTQWIEPAIAHQYIHFAFEERGRPLAYWTWAFLAPDVEDRLVKNPNGLLHESEWNEGDHLWIMDFVAPHGYVRDVVKYMQESFFAKYEIARSIRRNNDGSLRSESAWHSAVRRIGHRGAHESIYHLPSTAFGPSQTEWFEAEREREIEREGNSDVGSYCGSATHR